MNNPRFLLAGECVPLRARDRVRVYASRGPYVCIYPHDTIAPCKWTHKKALSGRFNRIAYPGVPPAVLPDRDLGRSATTAATSSARWRESSLTPRVRWSSELTQSLSQRPHLANLMPQPPARGDRLGGVEAMLEVAVVRSLWSTRPRRSTMHPPAPFPGDGGRPAGRSRACPGATPSRLAQLFWLLGRVYGVVRHFSRSAPALPSLKPD
jgi:hypothetical protein